MDFLRSGYKSQARLWQGDPTEVDIRWFRAEPEAQLVPQPNPYVSGVWDGQKDTSFPTLGEVVGAARKWDNGANPVGYLGSNHCGTEHAWRFGGVHGVDPSILTDAKGDSTCCHQLTSSPEGGFALGGLGLFLPLVRPRQPFTGGKRVGGSFLVALPFHGGKRVGGSFPRRLKFSGGKRVGGSLTGEVEFSGGKRVGGEFEASASFLDGKVVGGPIVSIHPIPGGTVSTGGFGVSYHLTYAMDGGKRAGGAFELAQVLDGGKLVGGTFPVRTSLTGGKKVGGGFLVSRSFAGGKRVGGAFTVEDADVIPAGVIAGFGGASVPSGWLLCDGSTFSSVTYPALATALGDTWGIHSGTSYVLPDLRGRAVLGAGTGGGLTNRALGSNGGAESVTQSGAQVGPHHHGQQVNNSVSGGSGIGSAATYSTGSGVLATNVNTADNAAASPMGIMPPWAAAQWIVKV